jgi:S1-C subfamily serine protease
MVVDKMNSIMNASTGASREQSVFSDRLKYNPLKTNVQGEAVINVTVAKTTQRYRAASVTLSEKHDIALGKVDLPGDLHPVTMSDSDAGIAPGQEVVVMGYPAVSPDAFGVEASRDMFTSKTHVSVIADPTLTTGPISKVISSGNNVRGVDGYISGGEVYQLGINTTGAGNSGGPVFDSNGRVIAVFYAGGNLGGAAVTYAVPVKFGRELIDNSPVIK